MLSFALTHYNCCYSCISSNYLPRYMSNCGVVLTYSYCVSIVIVARISIQPWLESKCSLKRDALKCSCPRLVQTVATQSLYGSTYICTYLFVASHSPQSITKIARKHASAKHVGVPRSILVIRQIKIHQYYLCWLKPIHQI